MLQTVKVSRTQVTMCGMFVLLFSFGVLVLSQSVQWPAQTLPADDQIDSAGWTPKPTKAPSIDRILKRQGTEFGSLASGSVCGFVTHDPRKNTAKHVSSLLTIIYRRSS